MMSLVCNLRGLFRMCIPNTYTDTYPYTHRTPLGDKIKPGCTSVPLMAASQLPTYPTPPPGGWAHSPPWLPFAPCVATSSVRPWGPPHSSLHLPHTWSLPIDPPLGSHLWAAIRAAAEGEALEWSPAAGEAIRAVAGEVLEWSPAAVEAIRAVAGEGPPASAAMGADRHPYRRWRRRIGWRKASLPVWSCLKL